MSNELFFSLHFRPVGQGLFSHGNLQFKDEEKSIFEWVYDCGAKSLQIAERQIGAYQAHNVGDIDLLMLSHFHRDHVRGIRELLVKRKPTTIVAPYLSLAERLEVISSSDPADQDYVGFLLNPAVALRESAPSARIVFVLPGGNPPPEQSEGDGTNPNSPWPQVGPSVQREDKPLSQSTDSWSSLQDSNVDSDLQRARAYTIDGSRPFVVKGLWEYCFYNKPRPEMEKPLLKLIKPSLQTFERSKKTADAYKALVANLRSAFKKARGPSKKPKRFDPNEISLIVFSGPARRKTQNCRRDSIPWITPTSIDSSATVITHDGWPRFRDYEEGRCAALFTGDITLDDDTFKDLTKHLGGSRVDRIAYFQVPHHGGADSFKLSPKQFQPDYSIFSSDRHHFEYKHPSYATIAALEQCNPLFVNEFQGLTIGGFVYEIPALKPLDP